MLLAEGAEGLLPEWAFFARCVVDATRAAPDRQPRGALRGRAAGRRPARSSATSCAAGWCGWPPRDPRRLGEFLEIHHLGVKALALHDDEMLRLVEQWWPVETNVGRMTLAEFRERHGVVRYARPIDEFRQLAAVAAAQDLAVVNAGYTYDAEIIERLPAVDRVDPHRAAGARAT